MIDAKNKISAIVRICQQHFWAFPTISVSKAGEGYFVILIGNSSIALPELSHDPICKIFRITESDILDRLLNRDKILAKLFANAIVLKDDLHIMQLIMNSIPTNCDGRRNRFYRGEIEITFHNVNSPHQFVSKTFIPFMEIAKMYLSKCQFILSSQMCNGKMDVSVEFFGTKHDFSLIGLKRSLIKNVSELYLHSISISKLCPCRSVTYYPIDLLKDISSQFILLYSKSEDNIDAVVRNIVALYMKALLQYTESQKECRIVNRQIFDRMLPSSLSSISAEFLLHEDIVNAFDEINKEYGKQFENNRRIFFELISSLVNEYKFIGNALKNVSIYSDCQKLTFLEHLYSDIFSASMMHPYYRAFIPFCINEVLKYEV